MTRIEAIAVQHEGWPHLAQPCWVGDFPCDVQTLLAEIATLRAALDGLVEAVATREFPAESGEYDDARDALAAAKETP